VSWHYEYYEKKEQKMNDDIVPKFRKPKSEPTAEPTQANISEDQPIIIDPSTQAIADLTEALQRERADSTNIRRRAEEDKLKMAGYYKASVLKQLLPSLDNLDRALVHAEKMMLENPESINKDYDSFVKGVQGVVKQLHASLDKMNVTKIKTVGEHFDPNLHEAISMEDEGGDAEIVSEELQSGWMIGEELVRPAMVKVKK
jgi:molecular chaperone GrpE